MTCFFPANSSGSYLERQGEWRTANYGDDPGLVTFHDICWRILLARLTSSDYPDFHEVVAKYLALLLFFTPKDASGALNTRHNYGLVGRYP